MNLSDYRTRLTDVYGSVLTSDDTLYNRVINDAYRKLCALADWWWLETYDVLTFNAPVVTSRDFDCTDGTADIVPSASADAIGTAYNYGWVYTGEHTYRISTIDASSPWTVTLDSNWIETSSAFQITAWNDTLTLSTAFDHAVQLVPRKQPNRDPLRHVDLSEIEKYGPDVTPHYGEVARMYAVYRETAIDADQFRIRIFPPPSEEVEYILRYVQTPSDLANDTATAMVPTKHEPVLSDMARLELLKVTGADPTELTLWEEEAQKGLARMANDHNKKGNVLKQFGRRGTVHTKQLPYRLVNYTIGDPI